MAYGGEMVVMFLMALDFLQLSMVSYFVTLGLHLHVCYTRGLKQLLSDTIEVVFCIKGGTRRGDTPKG